MAKAYEGDKPYIFVSYSHKDREEVIGYIEALQKRGFRVWFDGGVEAGSEWPEYIANHLAQCDCLLAFISEHFVESKNCRRELVLAQDLNKEQLNVYLRPVELPLGMRMQLGLNQAIFRENFDAADAFVEELCRAKLLHNCREEQKAPPKPAEEKPPKPAQTPKPAEPVAEPVPEAAPKNAFEELEALGRSGKLVVAEEPEKKPEKKPAPPKEPAPEIPVEVRDSLLKKRRRYTRMACILELLYVPISLAVMYFITDMALSGWWLFLAMLVPHIAIALINRARFRKVRQVFDEAHMEKNAMKDSWITVTCAFLLSSLLSVIGGMFALQTQVFFLVRLLIALGLNLIPFLVGGLITLLMEDH